MATATRRQYPPRLVVGLMSGTSADGIDAVVAKIAGAPPRLTARVLAHLHRPFSRRRREHILRLCLAGTVTEICELNFALGESFASAALAVIHRAGLTPGDVWAIGSHGQTVHHLPRGKPPSTLQVGEPAVIAERTGITTVANFRVRDMAAGGQGAPLVAFADWALFRDESRPRIVQNIGGVANLTFLPVKAESGKVKAFDTGPGNMVIDGVVHRLTGGRQAFDKDGRRAIRGAVSKPLLDELLAHPFLRRSPPKTTGREEFGAPFVTALLRSARRLRLPNDDIVATATAFTAHTIARAYRRFVFPRLTPPEIAKLQIILGGGGAKNPALRKMLGELLAPLPLLTHEDFGIADCAKEALAFALLAHATLCGWPGNIPSATGARRAVVLGSITPGGYPAPVPTLSASSSAG